MSAQTDLYQEMLDDILALTARPDLEVETELALRTATLNAHLTDAYPRDLQSTPVQLPNASYLTQLNIPTLFPKLRGLSKVQALDVNYAPLIVSQEKQISIIELGDIYDEYGALRNNVAYIGGDSINIRSLVNSSGYLVSWFKMPLVRRVEYNSWIAQLYPTIITFWAASLVLETNGNEAKAAKYMQMTQQIHVPFLKQNFLLTEQR